MVAPFDLRTREITGPSATVLEGVNVNWFNGPAAFSVANGSLAYLRAGRSSDTFVRYVDREGRSNPVLEDRRPFEEVKLSPDAKRLALGVTGANDQIWLYDLARRTLSRLTFGWDNFIVGWTPDGERLTIQSDRVQNSFGLFWQAVESPEPAERLTDNLTAHPDRGSWSPDGKLLAFTNQTSPATRGDIWVLELGPKRKTRPLIETPFDESEPTFSPDGRWLAYVSHESGRNEVYVQPFPGLGRKWQLSTDGGDQPVWARHGRELFYVNGHKMMAVSIRTGQTFVPGEPQLLFERSYQLYPYDVTPDGRFIMIEPAEPEVAPTEITLVQNWTEELKRRVPPK